MLGPHRKLSRTRSQPSSGQGSTRTPKTLRKTSSGSSIRGHTGSSAIRKGKHRSMSTNMSTLLKSPDRGLDPVQAFGDAYQADQGVALNARPTRKSQALRDELFNSIILNKTEQVTPLKVNTAVPLRAAPPAPNYRTKSQIDGEENTQLINQLARQKSGIEGPDGTFPQVCIYQS